MEHLKGGVESLSCLMNNPELRTIDYSKAELPPSAYLEFARARRIRYYGDNLEGMLKEAVDDRDIQEIRRLCELDITTDVALSAFDFNDESDIAIFHVLVPKATKEALTRCLGKYIVLLGYGHSSKKPSYVPTNRVEIVKWLLKSGAETSDAISGMAHPAEKDKEIFRLMLPTASQKVKTKLLQKNVKSFGDRDDWDRRVRQAADRLEIVRLLLESGADPNAKNFFDKTPLGNAVEYDGDLWLVKLLLDKGADPKLLYPDMEIFRGFYQGHGDNVWGTNRYELVELLLAHGFDVNARGRFERTPIGEVVVFGGGFGEPYDLKMAKLLLEHGADPNAKQGENLGSAIDMAYGKYNAKELIDLLAKYGGVVSEEAKQKKKERQNRQGEHPAEGHSSRRQGIPNGQSDRIHEEMNRFHEELRKCTNPEEHRKLFEEHSRRMREIRESSNREEMRMQRCKEEAE
jgi:ankyrin repeat protein